MVSTGFSWFGILVVILVYAVPAAIILFALYWVIRSAVGSALRRHELWLEERRRVPPAGSAGGAGALDQP
ncbi:hypothetical protein [Herbiconiux ginsengi]|uniref:Uncharacterized protein n=1 Tax=Herbiconiux ginsengi TaxID=381665 RepID=A0A1H3MJL0_9MICO|nr:hypothetical protein [Herbiconiux ginsengi]SDY76861.1 hypothetical protein SAMN05216554_1453 [Herbiconiux ginsengi]